eukprot:gnl/MRDRNA2_/MRDRNA2_122206_c0_seq1.p1 gnl/MRDRNA2_/MRDRNA2_122206_c0~~gnl/MRDRNA2_/MRDRNA2_122206_c0_seq1.p1  ORF type:complete len:221 (-),score=50.65 gnl/MRDRNA2_/MRDRNA2_122206_c0_seq1:6-668(-)
MCWLICKMIGLWAMAIRLVVEKMATLIAFAAMSFCTAIDVLLRSRFVSEKQKAHLKQIRKEFEGIEKIINLPMSDQIMKGVGGKSYIEKKSISSEFSDKERPYLYTGEELGEELAKAKAEAQYHFKERIQELVQSSTTLSEELINEKQEMIKANAEIQYLKARNQELLQSSKTLSEELLKEKHEMQAIMEKSHERKASQRRISSKGSLSELTSSLTRHIM